MPSCSKAQNTVKPTSSSTSEYSLDLGGLKAKIYAMGTNHTHGDTVVFVDGVLFSGDVAMRPQPSFANPTAKISHWLESLDKLEALKPKQIVPSHGSFGDYLDHRRLSQPISRASAIARPNSGKPARRRTKPCRSITDEMSAAISGQEPARGRDPRSLFRIDGKRGAVAPNGIISRPRSARAWR